MIELIILTIVIILTVTIPLSFVFLGAVWLFNELIKNVKNVHEVEK